jgi:hypothetical protein
MAWVALAEAKTITGDDALTAPQLAAADSVITIFANRTSDAVIGRRDAYWLSQAAAWQATWQAKQPGYTEQQIVSQVSQDGQSATFSGGQTAELAPILLAPLAARALKNLSWKGSRTIVIGTEPRAIDIDRNYRSESADDDFAWTPLGGGH